MIIITDGKGVLHGQYPIQTDKFENPIRIKSKIHKMFRKQNQTRNKLSVNQSYKADTLEIKVMKITQNKEPIRDGAPLRYTDRSEGVQPAYNIRTDRWDVALDAMDSVGKGRRAQRENKMGQAAKDGMEIEKKDEISGNSGEEGKA